MSTKKAYFLQHSPDALQENFKKIEADLDEASRSLEPEVPGLHELNQVEARINKDIPLYPSTKKQFRNIVNDIANEIRETSKIAHISPNQMCKEAEQKAIIEKYPDMFGKGPNQMRHGREAPMMANLIIYGVIPVDLDELAKMMPEERRIFQWKLAHQYQPQQIN